MKLLITGVSGMLGHSLARLACGQHEVWGSYRSFPVSIPRVQVFGMDLTDERQVRERVGSLKPEVIIHCAALTDVDECERNSFLANRINAQATKSLAEIAKAFRARIVYISTDYVFDGSRGDYVEADPPCPISVYGTSKLLGEDAVMSSCSMALVIRTSIFGFNVQPKTGVVEHVINCLQRKKKLTRFSDQFATPIYTGDLGRLVMQLLDRKATGLFHVGSGVKLSRYAFALRVADTFSFPRELIDPVPFRHLEGLARRPRDSSLCGNKVEDLLGNRLPKVEEGLRKLREDWDILKRGEVNP